MDLENLTNFNSVDIVVGDSRGMLTIFTNNQILSRRSLLDGSISSTSIEKDSGSPVFLIPKIISLFLQIKIFDNVVICVVYLFLAGNMTIHVGSLDGTLLAVSPDTTLHKQKLNDFLEEQKDQVQ